MHLSASLLSSIASLSLALLVAVPMVHTAPLNRSPYSSPTHKLDVTDDFQPLFYVPQVTLQDQDTKAAYRVRSELDARNILPVPRASQWDMNIDQDDNNNESLSPGAPGLDSESTDPVQSHSTPTPFSISLLNTSNLHQYPRAFRKHLQTLRNVNFQNLNPFRKTISITITFLEPTKYLHYTTGSITTPTTQAQATLIENVERLVNDGRGKLGLQDDSSGKSMSKLKIQYDPIHGKKNPYYISDDVDARFWIKVNNVNSKCGIANSKFALESCYGAVGWKKGEKGGTISDSNDKVLYP
ncbi:hypothetical protein F5879DRAFT_990709 [Lentinula edodes]|nr:hypothetical protein F5879DRAFT_990709 [Lentinula edodes]